jgi:hypothetical protein
MCVIEVAPNTYIAKAHITYFCIETGYGGSSRLICFRTVCGNNLNFHTSLEKAQEILELLKL